MPSIADRRNAANASLAGAEGPIAADPNDNPDVEY
jgi:hypothetical protein